MNADRNGKDHSTSQFTDPYVFLFSITLFLSAALTFTIQPMVGKLLLPLVGGTPSGWLVTMVYFQVALLAGYGIAHLLSRLPVFAHVGVVIGLLLLGLVMFPLHLHAEIIDTPNLPEAARVLLTLFMSLTLPCVALFTLSPTMQRLFEAGSGKSARDPYFLFAASNLGSLGGLLAYPLIIEHVAGLADQTDTWQQKYKILIGLCLACAFYVYKQVGIPKAARVTEDADAPINWRRRGWWLLLAFIPSSLMLGVTSHVTSDLGGVPFFWVLPLTLYLLTFIMAFAQKPICGIVVIDYLRTASVAVLVAFFVKRPSAISVSFSEEAIFPLVAFFLSALFFHFMLAASRPSARRLTDFYLWVACGGALGGIFNTFAVPFLFPLPVEFFAVVILGCLIATPRNNFGIKNFQWKMVAASVPLVGLALVYGLHPFPETREGHFLDLAATLVLVGGLVFISLQPRLLAGLSIILGVITLMTPHGMTRLDTYRDFFGVLRVFETKKDDTTVRTMFHGTTLHGLEQIAPQIDITPHSYHDVKGPLGDLMKTYQPSSVGILGMGAGITLCYTAPGRHYTIYEIDPAVPMMAEKWFDYVRMCGTPEYLIGDGRKMLAAEKARPHDLLTVDVFTSDSIPIHLITTEAFKVYFDHLKPDGILGIHISNRFYDLRRPISNIVHELGLHALFKDFKPAETEKLTLTMHSQWVVVAHDEAQLERLRQQGWVDLPAPSGRPWTDDFSDALSALKILQPADDVNHAKAH